MTYPFGKLLLSNKPSKSSLWEKKQAGTDANWTSSIHFGGLPRSHVGPCSQSLPSLCTDLPHQMSYDLNDLCHAGVRAELIFPCLILSAANVKEPHVAAFMLSIHAKHSSCQCSIDLLKQRMVVNKSNQQSMALGWAFSRILCNVGLEDKTSITRSLKLKDLHLGREGKTSSPKPAVSLEEFSAG